MARWNVAATMLTGCWMTLATPVLASTIVRTLPIDLNYFGTTGSGGPINPQVLVAFNPQPDPPGSPTPTLDFADPMNPNFSLTGTGNFTVIFELKDPSGEGYQFSLPALPSPNVDGHATYTFLATPDDTSAEVFQIVLEISGMTGDAVSFNPQPDPDDAFEGGFTSFAFPGDPTLGWTLEGGTLNSGEDFVANGSLSDFIVPEPASLVLLMSGIVGIAAASRRRITG